MTIPEYLAELRLLLPSTRRERFLREVEAHLREATDAHVRDGLVRTDAEARAVAEFGSVAVVAEWMRRATAPVEVRRAAGVAFGALALLFLPLYAIPENLLPPAPWPTRPSYLSVLLGLAVICWLVALALTVLAAFAPPRLAAWVLALAALLGAGCGTFALAAATAWHVEAPSTPWSIVIIALPLAVAAVLGSVGAAAWARERARAVV